MINEWPAEFERLVRAYLPFLPEDLPFTPQSPLLDLGLDSLSTVGLIVDVEECFDIQFPDDALTQATFKSAGSLWSVIQKLRQ